MIFQDPLSSFNPRLTIGKQITEVLFQHKRVSKSEAKSMTIDILEKVGINMELLKKSMLIHMKFWWYASTCHDSNGIDFKATNFNRR